MNSLLYFSEEAVSPGVVQITGARAEYILNRNSFEPGQEIKVLEWAAGASAARVIEASGQITFELGESLEVPAKSGVSLIVAVPRPQTVKKVLQAACMLGINAVHFVRSSLCEKSYFDSKTLTPDAIRQELVMGMEQALDPIPPRVVIHKFFKPFVEDVLPGLISKHKDSGLLLADTTESQSLSKEIRADYSFVAIGPESGWSEFERESFTRSGFKPFSLGLRQLRVETAVVASVSQLQLLRTF